MEQLLAQIGINLTRNVLSVVAQDMFLLDQKTVDAEQTTNGPGAESRFANLLDVAHLMRHSMVQ